MRERRRGPTPPPPEFALGERSLPCTALLPNGSEKRGGAVFTAVANILVNANLWGGRVVEEGAETGSGWRR